MNIVEIPYIKGNKKRSSIYKNSKEYPHVTKNGKGLIARILSKKK